MNNPCNNTELYVFSIESKHTICVLLIPIQLNICLQLCNAKKIVFIVLGVCQICYHVYFCILIFTPVMFLILCFITGALTFKLVVI